MREPPAQGITVRAEGTGFHVRAWPSPEIPWRRWAVGGALIVAAAIALAWVAGDALAVRVQVGLAIVAFGALLALFSHASGWMPVELQIDEATVYWNGERFPTRIVRGARADGRTLRLLGQEGPLAEVEHLPPEVAAWLAEAITEALSGDGG